MTPTPLILRITKHLPWAERVFIIAVVVGIILSIFKINSSLLSIALLCLAATFFLNAYKPMEIERTENAPLGFSDLLATAILPKVLWIGTAVSTLGLWFYLFNNAKPGYKNLLIVGSGTVSIVIVSLVFFFASGIKNMKVILPILLRAVPVLLMGCFILFLKS